MAKPEWGTKRTCPSCDVRFYDLRRNPIRCPKCNSLVESEVPLRSQRLVASKKVVKPAMATTAAEASDTNLPDIEESGDVLVNMDEENEIEAEEEEDDRRRDGEDEDALMEDASDLGVDDDDMAEVMEHLEDNRDT